MAVTDSATNLQSIPLKNFLIMTWKEAVKIN